MNIAAAVSLNTKSLLHGPVLSLVRGKAVYMFHVLAAWQGSMQALLWYLAS